MGAQVIRFPDSGGDGTCGASILNATNKGGIIFGNSRAPRRNTPKSALEESAWEIARDAGGVGKRLHRGRTKYLARSHHIWEILSRRHNLPYNGNVLREFMAKVANTSCHRQTGCASRFRQHNKCYQGKIRTDSWATGRQGPEKPL
jgi:hypothetical protein